VALNNHLFLEDKQNCAKPDKVVLDQMWVLFKSLVGEFNPFEEE